MMGDTPLQKEDEESLKYKQDGGYYISYFSENNIELDILRIIFFKNLKGKNPNIEFLEKSTIYEYINENFVDKLCCNKLLEKISNGYSFTSKGIFAISYIINPILFNLLHVKLKKNELAERIFNQGYCFGGKAISYQLHEKLINAFLNDLIELGIIKENNGNIDILEIEQRMKLSCSVIIRFICTDRIKNQNELNETLLSFKRMFQIRELSDKDLLKHSNELERKKILSIMNMPFKEKLSLMQLIDSRLEESKKNGDDIGSVAFMYLKSKVLLSNNDENSSKSTYLNGLKELAIFSKKVKDYETAAKFYEEISKIYSNDPLKIRNMQIHLANAYQCKATVAIIREEYEKAIEFYEKAYDCFNEVGMENESLYCKAKMLESTSRKEVDNHNFLAASEICLKISKLYNNRNKKREQLSYAQHLQFRGRYEKSRFNYKEASSILNEAGEIYRNWGIERQSNFCIAMALECEAFFAKLPPKREFAEISQIFFKSSEYYKKADLFPFARSSEADALKFLALNYKIKGDYKHAIENFEKAKIINKELSIYNISQKDFYEQSSYWCEAAEYETMALDNLIKAIQKRENLDEVVKLLEKSAEFYKKANDMKPVEIVSGFIFFVKAIDAFHNDEIQKANSYIDEAKSILPSSLVFIILDSKVDSHWQPLRYTIEMIEKFNQYTSRLETEKGISFESRIREALVLEYRSYNNIKTETFTPEEDEIGIVFPDKTQIEIDIFGFRIHDNRNSIIIGEIKNISKLVPPDEIIKFLNKVVFVQKRYQKISKLQNLDKPIIEKKIFLSKSELEPKARRIAEENGIDIIEGDEVNILLKKHHMFPIRI